MSFAEIERGASLIIAWQIKGQTALLVGGGAVAAGRLSALLAADAHVVLVTPSSGLSAEVQHRLSDPSTSPSITYHDRQFVDSDLDDAKLVLTAIDDPTLSTHIAKQCRAQKIPVNVADVPPECDFYFGSIVRNGPLQIMISTQGKGPRIANRIRRRIESSLPSNVGMALENVGKLRMRLRKKVPGGGPDIERRMSWMIDVCDRWTLSQLASMDDEMIEDVLEGYDRREAKSYYQLKSGHVGKLFSTVWRCPVAPGPDGNAWRCPFLLGTTSFLAGVSVAAVVFSRWRK